VLAVLSSFEQELMLLVVIGAKDDKIARRLGLSTSEVRGRIEDLLKRLGLSKRIELLFYVCYENSRI
jgi:DNA-binding NarL/FixJ family response regulator